MKAETQPPTPPDCRQTRDRMQDYLDQTLPKRESLAVFLHVRECGECSAQSATLQSLYEQLNGLPPLEAPADFDARVLAAVPYAAYRAMAPLRSPRVPVLGAREPAGLGAFALGAVGRPVRGRRRPGRRRDGPRRRSRRLDGRRHRLLARTVGPPAESVPEDLCRDGAKVDPARPRRRAAGRSAAGARAGAGGRPGVRRADRGPGSHPPRLPCARPPARIHCGAPSASACTASKSSRIR